MVFPKSIFHFLNLVLGYVYCCAALVCLEITAPVYGTKMVIRYYESSPF